MSLTALLIKYGYAAVLVGTFLEGETILVMAGFAAARGYLDLPWVIGVAVLGSFLGDQLYFFLGGRYGWCILKRFPRFIPRAERVKELLHRYHTPLILAIRFLYGLRIAGPFAIGMCPVSRVRFFVLNLVGAIIWAVLIAGTGYLFGYAVELLLADMKRYEETFLILIVVAGIVMWGIHRIRRR